jgi:hypothetical protein
MKKHFVPHHDTDLLSKTKRPYSTSEYRSSSQILSSLNESNSVIFFVSYSSSIYI